MQAKSSNVLFTHFIFFKFVTYFPYIIDKMKKKSKYSCRSKVTNIKKLYFLEYFSNSWLGIPSYPIGFEP